MRNQIDLIVEAVNINLQFFNLVKEFILSDFSPNFYHDPSIVPSLCQTDCVISLMSQLHDLIMVSISFPDSTYKLLPTVFQSTHKTTYIILSYPKLITILVRTHLPLAPFILCLLKGYQNTNISALTIIEHLQNSHHGTHGWS